MLKQLSSTKTEEGFGFRLLLVEPASDEKAFLELSTLDTSGMYGMLVLVKFIKRKSESALA